MEKVIFAQALGLQEPWEIESIRFETENGKLEINIGPQKESNIPCPVCGEPCKPRDFKEKTWRHLDFFQHECYINAKVPRTKCPKHGVLLASVPWSAPRSGFTQLFEAFAMVLAREMPVNAAARLLRMHDTQLWRIVRKHVNAARENADYSNVKKVGIDETSVKTRHSYISLFVDLESKRLLFGTSGNTHDAVRLFAEDLERHGGSPESVSDVACDLWRGFEKGAKDHLPNADITYDRFHFVKKINEAMDAVRKAEGAKKKELKGMRFLFLKNPENLTEEERAKLKPLREDNSELARAYNLKASLLGVYECDGRETALAFLGKWAEWAQRSKLKPFVQLAKSVRRNAQVIVQWHVSRITNAFLEGINSVIQAAKNKARGFRNPDNFISIAYLLAGKLDLRVHSF